MLSCADSRVPVELMFDQSIGHVFVTRVAGNVITPELIGSLEYGAAVLGTKVILVMGHSNCGAVKATMQGKEVPGQISSLFPHIRPAVDQAGTDLAAATKANAKIQAELLSQSSTVISGMVKSGSVKVVAGYYDVGNGSVTHSVAKQLHDAEDPLTPSARNQVLFELAVRHLVDVDAHGLLRKLHLVAHVGHSAAQ